MESPCNLENELLVLLGPADEKLVDADQSVIDKLVELQWLKRSPISGALVKSAEFKSFESKTGKEIMFSINEEIQVETQTLDKVERVYWARSGKSKASRTHLTQDRSKTLCGYKIPGGSEFDKEYRRMCFHCLDEAENLE